MQLPITQAVAIKHASNPRLISDDMMRWLPPTSHPNKNSSRQMRIIMIVEMPRRCWRNKYPITQPDNMKPMTVNITCLLVFVELFAEAKLSFLNRMTSFLLRFVSEEPWIKFNPQVMKRRSSERGKNYFEHKNTLYLNHYTLLDKSIWISIWLTRSNFATYTTYHWTQIGH